MRLSHSEVLGRAISARPRSMSTAPIGHPPNSRFFLSQLLFQVKGSQPKDAEVGLESGSSTGSEGDSVKNDETPTTTSNLTHRCSSAIRLRHCSQHAPSLRTPSTLSRIPMPREGEESIKEMRKLCNDFHETLFIIDHALHKYRNEHNKASGQGGKHLQEEGDHRRHHYDHDTDDAYRLLSEINEQLTDYAFLIGHKIHPWDIPYVFEQSTNSASTDAPGAPQIQFPPATWKNRVLRQATTPLAGFPLENSAHSEDKLT